jgi:hypothetical protein
VGRDTHKKTPQNDEDDEGGAMVPLRTALRKGAQSRAHAWTLAMPVRAW